MLHGTTFIMSQAVKYVMTTIRSIITCSRIALSFTYYVKTIFNKIHVGSQVVIDGSQFKVMMMFNAIHI